MDSKLAPIFVECFSSGKFASTFCVLSILEEDGFWLLYTLYIWYFIHFIFNSSALSTLYLIAQFLSTANIVLF